MEVPGAPPGVIQALARDLGASVSLPCSIFAV